MRYIFGACERRNSRVPVHYPFRPDARRRRGTQKHPDEAGRSPLGELPDGSLVHIELQSRNEKDFPLRMAEYLSGVGRQYGRLPRQVALYVDEAPLRMKDRVEVPDVSVRFQLDIRDLRY